MTKLIANPFFVYITSFTLVLLVYCLGWSGLYPSLSLSLLSFFVITFFISFLFGVVVHVMKRIEYQAIEWNVGIKFYLLLVFIGYVLEFIYNKGIPLQLLLQGSNYDYTLFGIPTFHVFLVTFSSFLSVYIFHQLVSHFTKKGMLYFLLSIAPAVLIVNRGMLLMILTSCLFVFLLSLNKLNVKVLLGVILMVLVVFYLFGVMGNLRQTNGRTSSSEYILVTSKATESFKQSVIPEEFIWSYLYISSPLANLQNTILKSEGLNNSWSSFFNHDILPDFISKRVGAVLEIEKKEPILVAPWLTVSTFYARSFVSLGWIGIILMFLFFIGTSLVYVLLLRKKSTYFVTGLAILNCLVLYNTFDNMYMFSGLNLQLVYPLVLSYIRFPRFVLKKKLILGE